MVDVERLDTQFDLKRLIDHFETHVRVLPPEYNGKTYHGWSVQSRNGNYQDGWHHGSSVYETKTDNELLNFKQAEKIELRADTEFRKPTEICHGYLAQIMDKLWELGFCPGRARIIGLPPQSKTNWHRDHRDGFYWVRLHIPIYTNEKCFFITENSKTHMPADGSSYLVNTAQMHEAINEGAEERYHLVMQVWDTKNQTAHFRHGADKIQVI